MLLKLVPLSVVFAKAGLNAIDALGKPVVDKLDAPGACLLVTSVADCSQSLDGTKFFKSILDNVDDEEKRSNFATMVGKLYRAAQFEDFSSELANIGVTSKPAHSFTYVNKTHKVWELKQGKKDRIYFFTLRYLMDGKNRTLIVLLLAEHKNSKTTPDAVKNHAELVMKNCLNPQLNLVICKEES